MNFTITAA